MNDRQIREAFPLPAESSGLDAKIDRAIARHTRGQTLKRRVVFGFAATAALTFALAVLPAVEAQASLSGIVHALDKETRVRVTSYNVDEQGRRWLNGTTTIADGDVATIGVQGDRRVYEVGNRTYVFDPMIKRYIVHPRQPGGSIRLSDLLGAGGFSMKRRAEVKSATWNGRTVLRATIVNGDLPERYVVNADPRTELPLQMRVESRERGTWRTRTEMTLDYETPVEAVRPDLRRYPAITPAAAEAAFQSAMTERTLADVPFADAHLIVRAIDVAQDGTVFVAYQRGERRPHTWSGYSLNLKDSLGTPYLRELECYSRLDGPFTNPGGGLLMEVFVPARSVAASMPRVLTFTSQRYADGRLARMFPWVMDFRTGRSHPGWGPGEQSVDTKPLSAVPVLNWKAAGATCGVAPAWAAKLSMEFYDPVGAQITLAGVRAKAAMQAGNWTEAEARLNEKLALMREHERQGGSPYAQGGTLEDLDRVHATMGGRIEP